MTIETYNLEKARLAAVIYAGWKMRVPTLDSIETWSVEKAIEILTLSGVKPEKD